MLYIYEGKVYVRPFDSKLVEVKISKKGDEYDVTATEKTLEINESIRNALSEVIIEDAYNFQNKSKNKLTKDFDLDLD